MALGSRSRILVAPVKFPAGTPGLCSQATPVVPRQTTLNGAMQAASVPRPGGPGGSPSAGRSSGDPCPAMVSRDRDAGVNDPLGRAATHKDHGRAGLGLRITGVPLRCPRTVINSQRPPPSATCEHEARTNPRATHENTLVMRSSPQSRRAISVQLTPVTSGLSRSLPDTRTRRSAGVEAGTAQIPKLMVRIRYHYQSGQQVAVALCRSSGLRAIAVTSLRAYAVPSRGRTLM